MWQKIKALALLFTTLGALPSAAATAPVQPEGSPTGTLTLEYNGVADGLTVLHFEAALDFSPDRYVMHSRFHTAGMFGFLVHSDNDTTVQGAFDGDLVAPSLFEGTGNLRGVARVTRLAYKNGNPLVLSLSPPPETERTLVPADQTHGTIDTMSAIVRLIRTVADTSHCDGAATTFDGRRLTRMVSVTAGSETLPPTSRSIFAGPTLRCDFTGSQLAGFMKGEDEASLRKPRPGVAWLAPLVPGAPPVPVKVIFYNKLLGEVTLFLTEANGGPEPAVASAARSQGG